MHDVKVISSTIQTNINLHMFRAKFLAKKFFLTSGGLRIFFPRKFVWGKSYLTDTARCQEVVSFPVIP